MLVARTRVVDVRTLQATLARIASWTRGDDHLQVQGGRRMGQLGAFT